MGVTFVVVCACFCMLKSQLLVMDPQIKEVQMDTPYEGGSRKKRGRRTRKNAAGSEGAEPAVGPVVEKAPASAPAAKAVTPTGPVVKTKSIVPVPTVIIAPPKKKPIRVLLVPSQATATPVKKMSIARKTYKAKCVRVIIDNTAKTQKKRRQTMQKIDALTDEQVRQTCLEAKLSRKETVAKVPIGLLRQMLKDYQTMRGSLL
jgi:hypothetical protein